MTLTAEKDSPSMFEDGKLKPGIYKIQNIVGQTYVDIRDHSQELCCRPASALEGQGLWEIVPSGPGYTIRRIEPGKPNQFCIMLSGLGNESIISVGTFPVAWRMEIAQDDRYRGCEYVCFFWGATDMAWDLRDCGSDQDRTPVQLKDNHDNAAQAHAPVSAGSSTLPPYNGNQGCTCSHQSTEASDDDGFGASVTEVTVTTTTVTTRKKYRVEGY
ncbi:hypothetical protein BJ322DRAFT_1161694 [Thelephora terrestris]|uniref:Uncharacterized protein n=1 Tax=Thelephora terrestris TaxID=56493 RepID=A0A9P6L4H0_9AGAM|nr:hypothetical protein BJ322DRAFT_1161694 [Thelephora terrestris]